MLDFLTKGKTPPEAFWSLILEPGLVQAGIWMIKDGAVEVIVTSPVARWSEDVDLSQAVDTALSACVQDLPESLTEPTKTVFGVPSAWVESGSIREEYLEKIKKICAELSLSPVGFVSLPEAISHYLKFEEGAPLDAITLGLRDNELELSLFKGGNLVGTTQVARSLSVSDDVNEGLSRFEVAATAGQGGGEPLPSRIIIYDGKEGELSEARNMLSGENWGGSEKVKFLHTPKVEILALEKKVLSVSLAGATEIAGISRIGGHQKEVAGLEMSPPAEAEKGNNLGFVVETQPSPLPPRFGWWEALKKIKLPKLPPLTVKLPLVLTILGLAFLALLAFWWFYPRATVIIYVSPKSFTEELEFAFSPEQTISTSISGEKTRNTTGKKTVGEKAKGTVVIRNGTAANISLSAGTLLLSAGNLGFTLDSSASVSAALSPDSPGTTTVTVTGTAIGAEYNLAKDEIFKVGNYPRAEVDAVAADNFSGGSSREISAVSEDDRNKLKEELEAELAEKVKRELSAKAGPEQMFIPELVSFTEKEVVFSHKVGDEADNLQLSLSVDARGIITDKKQLAASVREKIKDKIPQGYVLRDNQIAYKFEFLSEDADGNFVFRVAVKVNFLPEINQDEVIGKISGRPPEIVENYLAALPGFSRAEIKLNPRFPGRLGRLPWVKKNITLEMTSE